MDFWTELKSNRVQALSAIGSVASIVALGIVLLDKIAANEELPSQMASWRVVFFLVSFLGLVTAVLAFSNLAYRAYSNILDPFYKRVFHIGVFGMFGLLIAGICLDGLFAALNWEPWLQWLPSIGEQFLSGLGLIEQ
jgi:hypothetical protein